jgi:hypothetical protein
MLAKTFGQVIKNGRVLALYRAEVKRKKCYFSAVPILLALSWQSLPAVDVTWNKATEIVTELKLDPARFKTDLESPEIASVIDRNHKLAEKLGVQSTPTFVIGNEVVPGALTEEAFRPLIEAARHQQRIASAKPPAKSR